MKDCYLPTTAPSTPYHATCGLIGITFEVRRNCRRNSCRNCVFFASPLCFPRPSVGSCRLALSWECFVFFFRVFVFLSLPSCLFTQAFRGQMQSGSFMGVLLFALLLFFASLLCFPKLSMLSCRLAISWVSFCFLCFSSLFS